MIYALVFMYTMGYVVSLSCLHDMLHPEPYPESVEAFEYILILFWPVVVLIVIVLSVWDWYSDKKALTKGARARESKFFDY